MSGEGVVSEEDASQLSSELDTEPVLPFSSQRELQDSCDTNMSEESNDTLHSNKDPIEDQSRRMDVDNKEADCLVEEVDSSLEVLVNDSSHNDSSILIQKENVEDKEEEKSQGAILPDELLQTSSERPREQNKRKASLDDSPVVYVPAVKKFHPDSSNKSQTPHENCSVEVVTRTPEQSKSCEVVDISSETTLNHEESQEFSLRIEEDTSPIPAKCGEKSTNSGGSWSPQGQLIASWQSSHHDDILSWSSHKSENESKTITENQCKQETGEKDVFLTPEDVKDKDTADDTRTHWTQQVLQLATVRFTMKDNVIVSREILQASFLEDTSNIEKQEGVPIVPFKGTISDGTSGENPGRVSIVSSISTTSSGSNGLPGPFALPNRYSIWSSVSTSSSSSSGIVHQGCSGLPPKLKVPLEATGKLSCGLCHGDFPLCDKGSSRVVNGSQRISTIEEVLKTKAATPRRGRTRSKSAKKSPSTQKRKEESSKSPPQAASTPTPLKRGRAKTKTIADIDKRVLSSAKKETPAVAEKELTTPVKTRVATPGHTPMPPRVTEGKEEAVFAKWAGDKRYYPGWANLSGEKQHTAVHFCDGQKKAMSTTWVVRADIITAGTLVLVMLDKTSCEYEECLVVDVNIEGLEPAFKVERDNVSRRVQFSCVALLELQVLELTAAAAKAPSTSFNDVSLENIVSHSRKREVRTPLRLRESVTTPSIKKKKKRPETPPPSTSNGQTFGGPDSYYVDTDSSNHSICSIDLRGKEVRPLDVECSPPEIQDHSHVKQSLYRRNKGLKSKNKTPEEEPRPLVEVLGPIPEEGSKLFEGCVFLITYTKLVELQKSAGVGEATPFEDSEPIEDNRLLKKERLRTQIKNGGGKVYRNFSQVSSEEMPNTYLITDKPCNTMLYLKCLVNNVPIYSTSVISKCCSQNRPFKEIIGLRSIKKLPSGYSLARQCFVHARSSQPLQGKNVLLALRGESSFTAFWESIIQKVGGNCEVYLGGYLTQKRFHVIVADADCEPYLVSEACTQHVPLVSPTWLQQCVINGDFRSPTEHVLYKYNYLESCESPEY